MDLPVRSLGASDIQITVVGFGSWAAGGGGWAFGWGPQDDEQSIAAIHHAVDLGVNWVDTAAEYGHGHSEEVVGRAVRALPESERPLVFTKCGLIWDDDVPMADSQAIVTPRTVRQGAEHSLRRLGMDHVDLFQIHAPDDQGQPDRGGLGRDGQAAGRGQGARHRRLQLRPRAARPLRGHRPRRFAAAAVLAHHPRCGRRGAGLDARARAPV